MGRPARPAAVSRVWRAVWHLKALGRALGLILNGPVRRYHVRGLRVFTANDGGADWWLLAPCEDAATWALIRHLWREHYRPYGGHGTGEEFAEALDAVMETVREVELEEQRETAWSYELGTPPVAALTLFDAARWARRGWAVDPHGHEALPWWRRIDAVPSLILGSTEY